MDREENIAPTVISEPNLRGNLGGTPKLPQSLCPNCNRRQSFPLISPLPNPHALTLVLRHYVQSSPHLFDRSSIAKQNLSHRANVICDGSPSRIRRVRRISFGMTIRPRSSACVKWNPKIFKNPYISRVSGLSTKLTLALL